MSVRVCVHLWCVVCGSSRCGGERARTCACVCVGVCACVCGPGGGAWRVVVALRGCDVAYRCRPHAVVRARQDGKTALDLATAKGHGAVVALLSAGADPNVQSKVGDVAPDAVSIVASAVSTVLYIQRETDGRSAEDKREQSSEGLRRAVPPLVRVIGHVVGVHARSVC